eukprot:286818_1
MGEEEEYQPIDYSTYKGKKRKANYKRATRNFVVDDKDAIEYKKPSKKKRKVNKPPSKANHSTDSTTSVPTSIINTMKQNKDYDARATTKLVASTAKPKDTKKCKPKSTRGKKVNSFVASTQLLIKQKTNQNSMHRDVALTVQEKYLKQHYKIIEKLVLKCKQNVKSNGDSFQGIHHLKEAMGTDLNISSTSCNIIVEPGQKENANDNEKRKNEMNQFNETFIKRSTNYIQQRNHASLKHNKKGIDIDDYFSCTTAGKDVQHTATMNEKQRMELNQRRALEKLKQLGNTDIGIQHDQSP